LDNAATAALIAAAADNKQLVDGNCVKRPSLGSPATDRLPHQRPYSPSPAGDNSADLVKRVRGAHTAAR
jgi:hypothetical protein